MHNDFARGVNQVDWGMGDLGVRGMSISTLLGPHGPCGEPRAATNPSFSWFWEVGAPRPPILGFSYLDPENRPREFLLRVTHSTAL